MTGGKPYQLYMWLDLPYSKCNMQINHGNKSECQISVTFINIHTWKHPTKIIYSKFSKA